MRDFRKYEIWLKAIEIVDDIYGYTKNFPKNEIFGLSNQIQRAAVSIPSNIAEGASRESESDFARFLEIALGSACEVETQIVIAHRRNYISSQENQNILTKLHSIEKQLAGLIKTLRHK